MLPVRFLPYSVYVDTGGGTDLWINQVESTSPDQNVTLFEESSGSQTDREFVATKLNAPTIAIATSDLSTLSTIGMAGVAITPTPGCVVYARELPLQSLPAATSGSVHLSIAVSDGLLIPVSARASNNEAAKLNLILHAILGSNGSSLATPMVMTDDVAIPGGAGATVNIYTTGVVKYTISSGSSRLVYGIMEQTVDFGIQVLKESDSGEAYPTQVAIIKRMPRMSFTTKDLELITEIGQGVSVSSYANYFRAVSQNGQRVPNATTSHVSIIGSEGMLLPKEVDQRYGQAGTASFEFVPTLNTNLLTISTSAAIPTS
jgi:hypothetical protein